MATPYAHSFCDKFLGALRHATPSILRQRGSAATLDEIREIVSRLAAQYGAKRVYLFGSYARGDTDDNRLY